MIVINLPSGTGNIAGGAQADDSKGGNIHKPLRMLEKHEGMM